MLRPRFFGYVAHQIVRQRTRTLLTVGGVATAMFLFTAVNAMNSGVRQATETTARDTTLVVYRANRYCPFTSRLPEYYADRIKRIAGVTSVVPMKIVPTNCRTSLDVITFRGVPEEPFSANIAPTLQPIEGSIEQWRSRTDAALVGEELARRRGFHAGDRFNAAGVTVFVAGVVRSDEPQDRNVAYVHLQFIQRAGAGGKLGVVTQFNVKVDDPARLGAVARAIDEEFKADPDPTSTSPEKAFVARAAGDVVKLVSFTRWLGWGCLAAVLALVANSIVLSVQDRIREHAVLQTLGYRAGLIARLIIVEGLLLGLIGGAIGAGAAIAVVRYGRFTLSAEGLSMQMTAGVDVITPALLIAGLLGALAGIVPAIQASRRPIVTSLRAI
ncbi:MAG: ABC transporter permease [Tepidisphaeraceae bacterium]